MEWASIGLITDNYSLGAEQKEGPISTFFHHVYLVRVGR